jgi:hypothetical protein
MKRLLSSAVIKPSFGFCRSIGCSVLLSWPSAMRLCLNLTFQRAVDFRQTVDECHEFHRGGKRTGGSPGVRQLTK